MSTNMNTSRVLERRSFDRGAKPGEDAVKAGALVKGDRGSAAESDEVASAVLTLDDFGGRSDALGG